MSYSQDPHIAMQIAVQIHDMQQYQDSFTGKAEFTLINDVITFSFKVQYDISKIYDAEVIIYAGEEFEEQEWFRFLCTSLGENYHDLRHIPKTLFAIQFFFFYKKDFKKRKMMWLQQHISTC